METTFCTFFQNITLTHVAILLAATIMGFFSGISTNPSAGNIVAAIVGFVGGFIVVSDGTTDNSAAREVAIVFIVFLIALVAFNILGNFCRRKRTFDCIWGAIKSKEEDGCKW